MLMGTVSMPLLTPLRQQCCSCAVGEKLNIIKVLWQGLFSYEPPNIQASSLCTIMTTTQ
jgi:hypothetical protein